MDEKVVVRIQGMPLAVCEEDVVLPSEHSLGNFFRQQREYGRRLPEKGGVSVGVIQSSIERESGQERTKGREGADSESRKGANVLSEEREGRWREEGPRILGDVADEVNVDGWFEGGPVAVAFDSAGVLLE